MGVLANILRRTRPDAKTATVANPPAWLRASATAERYTLPDLSLSERQADLYTKLSWIQIATHTVANAIATQPLNVLRMVGEKTEQVKNHPFEQLLRRPNPLDSRVEFLRATYLWRAITGNCYWWLNRLGEDAPPDEIFIIPAHQLQPVPDGNMFLRGYLYDAGIGEPIPLEPWEVVHFRTFNPLSRYVGLSPMGALRYAAFGDLAAQEFNANFYAQDQAKAQGILAFADPIDEDRWKRLRAEANEKHGGTKGKRIMFLRNVGPGGVQWIQTQMSQADLQYLDQRTFTKEEIFNLYAPGLASILAVNATEANSTAGKDTFLSMGVYPEHVTIAEKVSNDVLPAYGDDLIAEFADVRRVDTLIELQEQEAYERSHTVEEVRAKYYHDDPIGDERDDYSTQAFVSAKAPSQQPTPPALAPFVGQPPADQEPPTPEQQMAQAGKALDRRRWRDKAIKALAAGRAADVAFDPEYLSDGEAMAIRAALRKVRTAAEVSTAFKAEAGMKDFLVKIEQAGGTRNDVLGIWKHQDGHYWVSLGDWASSETAAAIRKVFGKDTEIEDEAGPIDFRSSSKDGWEVVK